MSEELVIREYIPNDCSHILRIFPEEIWVHITKKILAYSPTDLESISNSSTYFRFLLLENRVLFHFQKVFRILIFNALSETRACSRTRSYRNCSVILSYRMVCSTWNKAVDNHLQDKNFLKSLMQLDYLDNIERVALEVASNQMFSNVGENRLNLFLNHFQETHLPTSLLARSDKTRSPFIGRKVSILYYKVSDTDLEFLKTISAFLHRYGGHVLYFNLRTDLDYNQLKNYDQIRQWLSYVPNIISLELSTVNSVEDNELGNQTGFFKLPKFRNLQTLKVFDVPNVMRNELIRNNSNTIIKLHVSREESNELCLF